MQVRELNFKKYKRFFAFGASNTNYCWPTWADIIGQEIPIYMNWGVPGAGNHCIFNNVMEADSRYHFGPDDLVIIMWSTMYREDRYLDGKWACDSVETQLTRYGKEWVKKFGTDSRSLFVRDIAYLKGCQTLLNYTNCDWVNFSFVDNFIQATPKVEIEKSKLINIWKNVFDSIQVNKDDFVIEHADLVELYATEISKIEAIYKVYQFSGQIPNLGVDYDLHPTPKQAFSFLQGVWPELVFSEETIKYVEQYEHIVQNLTETPIQPIHPVTLFDRL